MRPGKPPVDVDFTRLVAGISDRHVEIMRGELAAILHDATRHDVEYVFGDGIRSLIQDDGGVEVTFEHGAARRFDLVVGADGLHSTVRRLAFGDESRFRRYIGGYLAVYTVPNHLQLHGPDADLPRPGQAGRHVSGPADRAGPRGVPVPPPPRVRLRPPRPRPPEAAAAARSSPATAGRYPRLLADLDDADDFYFDSISQIVMDRWSDRRITLVGDAGYSPGPAVGGGTSVAVIGAYLLADALRTPAATTHGRSTATSTRCASSSHAAASSAPPSMKTLIPATRGRYGSRPSRCDWSPASRRRPTPAVRLPGGPATAMNSVTLPDEHPAGTPDAST